MSNSGVKKKYIEGNQKKTEGRAGLIDTERGNLEKKLSTTTEKWEDDSVFQEKSLESRKQNTW